MSEENKLIAKNTTILYFRLIITSIIGLFTSRFIYKSLGAVDYGLYNVVASVVVMMAFINTVMTSTTYRFIAFEMGRNNKKAVNSVFNISLVIHICIALIILLMTETLGVFYIKNYLNVDPEKVCDAIFVLRFSIYSTIFSVLSVPYQGLLTALERFSVNALIEIARSIFTFLLTFLLLYYIGNRLRLYSIFNLIVTLLTSILYAIYCYKKAPQIVKWKFQQESKKYKEMIGYSTWIMLGAAASVGQRSVSSLIVNSFFGTIINAAYGIANMVNNIVSQFSQSLTQAAIPQITKSYSNGNIYRSILLSAYISKYTMFLLFLISVPLLLETKFLINIWLGKVPEYTIVMTKLIIINTLVCGLGAGLPALIQATGKIKWFQIILSFTSLLSLPIAYILFKWGYPPYYIIITFIITAFLNVFIWQILLKKVINFDIKSFIKVAYLKALYIFILIIPLFILIESFNQSLYRFIFFSLISVIYITILIYFIGLNNNEKNKIKLHISNMKIKYDRNK